MCVKDGDGDDSISPNELAYHKHMYAIEQMTLDFLAKPILVCEPLKIDEDSSGA